MSRPRKTFGYAVLTLALVTSACGFEQRTKSPLAPSEGETMNGYLGDWASAAPITVPSPSACTNVHWTVNNWVGTTVSGSFTATCAGGLQATGTGSATLTTTDADWAATGTATQSGVNCPFNLSGKAKLASAKVISLNYSGTVCNFPVSGSENLQK